MKFSIFQDSAVGARPANQDRMGYCFTRDSLLMVVADGLGGHPRGEVAALIATRTAAEAFQREARPALADPVEFLDRTLRDAHEQILRYQQLNGLDEAPRTTVVACAVQGGRAWWAHAGDARLYRIRGGRLLDRTRDHSKVEAMVAMGLIAPDEADRHPERHKVLNCLGSVQEPTIELAGGVGLEPGDALLLCSDGVWSALPERELCARVSRGLPSESVPGLVRAAVEAAGPLADNTTALAMCWEDAGDPLDSLVPRDWQDGGVTTILHAAGDATVPEISDEEIERTIREIQEAIRRTART